MSQRGCGEATIYQVNVSILSLMFKSPRLPLSCLKDATIEWAHEDSPRGRIGGGPTPQCGSGNVPSGRLKQQAWSQRVDIGAASMRHSR